MKSNENSNENEYIIADEGASFELMEPGNYPAILCEFVEIGTVMTSFQGGPEKPVKKIMLGFEIPSERVKFGDEPERAQLIRMEFSQYLSPKASLRGFLNAWRGKDLTEDELKGFNLLSLMGASGLLNVGHKPGTGKNVGKTFYEALGMSRLPKGSAKPEPFTAQRVLTYRKWSWEIYSGLPKYIQDKMKISKEYKETIAGFEPEELKPQGATSPAAPLPSPQVNMLNQQKGQAGKPPVVTAPVDDDDDDQLPF
jgi:hypothetical protein